MRRATRVLWILLVAAAVSAPAWSADYGKVAPDLDLDGATGDFRVIVTYRPGTADEEIVGLAGSNGVVRHDFEGIHAFAGTMTAERLLEIVSDDRVLSVSPDRRVAGTMDVAVPTIGADLVETNLGHTGRGITVAVVDSGIAPGPALPAERILAAVDFTESAAGPDDFGHGTHVAGIIGGSGVEGSVRGVAPEATFVSLQVLDGNGGGYTSDVIEAVEWAIENREQYGIRILNLSLGHPVYESWRSDPLTREVERAWAAGLLVVTSAGNRGRDGYMTINSPGNDPYVLTIGAINDLNTADRGDDIATTYSSRGPSFGDHVLKPDLSAPGNRIVSCLSPDSAVADLFPDRVIDGDRIELSGSSMAAGVASGAAAILLERKPEMTPDQVKLVLMLSAEKVEGDDVFAVGAGRMNLVRALALGDSFRPTRRTAASPIVLRRDSAGMYILIQPPPLTIAIWGDQALSGDQALWGDIAIWGDQVLKGDIAIWGDTALWGDIAIWGDQVLRGDIAI